MTRRQIHHPAPPLVHLNCSRTLCYDELRNNKMLTSKDGKTYVRDLKWDGNDGLCDKMAFTDDGKAGGGLACNGGSLRL